MTLDHAEFSVVADNLEGWPVRAGRRNFFPRSFGVWVRVRIRVSGIGSGLGLGISRTETSVGKNCAPGRSDRVQHDSHSCLQMAASVRGPRDSLPTRYYGHRDVTQQQSVGLGIERSRVRNSLVPSGFSFEQGN